MRVLDQARPAGPHAGKACGNSRDPSSQKRVPPASSSSWKFLSLKEVSDSGDFSPIDFLVLFFRVQSIHPALMWCCSALVSRRFAYFEPLKSIPFMGSKFKNYLTPQSDRLDESFRFEWDCQLASTLSSPPVTPRFPRADGLAADLLRSYPSTILFCFIKSPHPHTHSLSLCRSPLCLLLQRTFFNVASF